MAGEIASAYLSIYPKLESSKVVDEIGKSMGGAGKDAGRRFSSSASDEISNGMGRAGDASVDALTGKFTAAKVAIGNVLADIAESAASEFSRRFGDGIEQSDALQKFANTMKFAGFDTKQIDSVRDAMKEYADQTVYDLGEVMDTTAKLAANGVNDYDKLVQAAGNLNAAAGGNSESFGYFANAITQVNGAGKLMSQDWNQIVNALPGASGAIQNELKEMGAWDDSMGTFKDAMAAGEISADEFDTALQNLGMTDVAKEAATSSTTFEGAMGQLDASVTNTMQGIYDSLNEDGRVTDAINGMADAFTAIQPYVSQVADAFGDLMEFLAPALPIIAGVAAGIAGFTIISSVVGAIAGFVSTAGAAIAMIGSVPGLIAVVTAALGGPITIIGAIIGAIVAFVATNEDMRNKVMEVFGAVQTTISGALDAVKAAWPSVQAAISAAVGVISGVVRTGFTIVRTVIVTAMNVVRSIVAAVSAAMKSTWSGALNAMKSAVRSAIGGIKSIFGTLKGAVMGALRGAGSWLVGAGRSIISGLVNGIRGAVGWVTGAVRSVCSNALGALKSFFKIGSPSRLMAEMGDYMMQGLSIGIDDGSTQTARTMGLASERIASALQLDGEGTARYGVATASAGGGTVYNVYLNDLAVNDDSGIVSVTRGYLMDLARLGAI